MQTMPGLLEPEEAAAVSGVLRGLPEELANLIIRRGAQLAAQNRRMAALFFQALPKVAGLGEVKLEHWLAATANLGEKHWEAAMWYLRSGFTILETEPPQVFTLWASCGWGFDRYEAQAAVWFFRQSPQILQGLGTESRSLVLHWCSRLQERAWQAATAYLRALPDLPDRLDSAGLREWSAIGWELAAAGSQPGEAYFSASPAVLRAAGVDGLRYWSRVGKLFLDSDPAVAVAFLAGTPGFLRRPAQEEFPRLLDKWSGLAQLLLAQSKELAKTFFQVSGELGSVLQVGELYHWVRLILRVAKGSSQSGVSFLLSSPRLFSQLRLEEVELWVQHGLSNLGEDEAQLVSFFALQSEESRRVCLEVRNGLEFEDIALTLETFAAGLTGHSVYLRSSRELPAELHKGCTYPATGDGRRIYLPPLVNRFGDKKQNLRLYKAMLLHELAHLEYATFPELGAVRNLLSRHPALLSELFEIVEDYRVDCRLVSRYPGVKHDFALVLKALSPAVPGKTELGQLLEARRELQQPDSTVWNSLEAALDLFHRAENRKVARMLDEWASCPGYRGENCWELAEFRAEVEDGCPETAIHNPTLRKKLTEMFARFAAEEAKDQFRELATYPEWDNTLNDYKLDWCTVREKLLFPSSGRLVLKTLQDNRGIIANLKRYFALLRPDRLQRYRRRQQGDQLDIDALVEAVAERKAGLSGPEGFYIDRDKRVRDVAVAFLLDLSQSTDEIIGSTGKSILEIEQEAVIVMAEALETIGDRYAIYGFSSDERSRVDFLVVKDFHEAYDSKVKQRFGSLRSAGTTRLGAAIRHATGKLAREKAGVRLLILLSDGRPYDFDYRHPGLSPKNDRYPEDDCRRALQETKAKGINAFCITVDQWGKEYLQYMFGDLNYIIVTDVGVLPVKLPELYKRLT